MAHGVGHPFLAVTIRPISLLLFLPHSRSILCIFRAVDCLPSSGMNCISPPSTMSLWTMIEPCSLKSTMLTPSPPRNHLRFFLLATHGAVLPLGCYTNTAVLDYASVFTLTSFHAVTSKFSGNFPQPSISNKSLTCCSVNGMKLTGMCGARLYTRQVKSCLHKLLQKL